LGRLSFNCYAPGEFGIVVCGSIRSMTELQGFNLKTSIMKKYLFFCALAAMSLLSLPALSQSKDKAKTEPPKDDTTALLGLAGDNLDLYAVLDVFQKSKTVEAFEKSLNDADLKLNNLDLNLDKKIDFIKVVTKKEGESYQFILRVDVTKTESQDVAVILLDKDKDKKISLQIVGDEELYGKDYVIEPKGNSSVTPNPGYKGEDPVVVTVPASTTTVQVVQSAPIVQYVYSPAYVPYAPPYYYGYYPPWFGFATVMAVGIYRSNNWGYHGGYYGGHYHGGNNNVIINNGSRNNINHYNNTNRSRSNTVSDNRAKGNYGNGAGANRRNESISNRQSPSVSNSMSNRQSSMSNRQSPSMSNSMSNRQSASPSVSNRQSSPSTNRSSSYSSPSRSSSSSYGGGGRSMGGSSRSYGGGGGGGRSMGGGGRRGR
jgi:hypothetical protein